MLDGLEGQLSYIIESEEILRELFTDYRFESAEELMRALEQVSTESRTAKLWIDNLLKPVFLMMTYVKAEREGDWLLHLATFKKMMPYYFAGAMSTMQDMGCTI